MDLFGYMCAVLIGLIMGLAGGGGSVLGVPIFAYIFGMDAVYATAYSLFVVGLTAGVGAITNARKGQIDVHTGIVFAIPAFIAVYLTRAFVIPWIPETICTIGSFTLSKDLGIMLLFALVMFVAGYFMVKSKKQKRLKQVDPNDTVLDELGLEEDDIQIVYKYKKIILEGFVIGVLTGLVGAGGGFVIVPALVLLANLPMKKAIGTSLMIICIKSLIGFIGDIQNLEIDWGFLALFSGLTIIGILVGSYFSNYIDGKVLKKGFGWFVIVMAISILVAELIQ